MPQGAINTCPRRLGAIGASWLSPGPSVGGAPAATAKDAVTLSSAAKGISGGSVEQQIQAIDGKTNALQAHRDDVLGDIRAVFRRLNADDAKVRGLQGQIDGLEARRKTLLNSAMASDRATLTSLDRQIATLESQKARTQKDLAALDKLRLP